MVTEHYLGVKTPTRGHPFHQASMRKAVDGWDLWGSVKWALSSTLPHLVVARARANREYMYNYIIKYMFYPPRGLTARRAGRRIFLGKVIFF